MSSRSISASSVIIEDSAILSPQPHSQQPDHEPSQFSGDTGSSLVPGSSQGAKKRSTQASRDSVICLNSATGASGTRIRLEDISSTRTTVTMVNTDDAYQLEPLGVQKTQKKSSTGSGDSLRQEQQPLIDFEKSYVDVESSSFLKLKRSTRDFYSNQNDEIDSFRRLQDLNLDDDPLAAQNAHSEAEARKARIERLVTTVVLVTNVLLLAILLTAVIISGALSLVASVMDAALDLLSGAVIMLTARAKQKVNFYRYPQGRERIEPVGILVFSAIMGTCSLMLIVTAVQLMAGEELAPPGLDWLSIGLVLGDIAVKAGLYLFCMYYRKETSLAVVLAQDQRNDVLVNSVALGSAALGTYVWPYLDPIGSILIALYTVYNWGSTCLEQITMLTGRSAEPEFLKQLTWICVNHDDKIVAIDTVRAFHFGTRYLVEIDVVLPPAMPLEEAHNIGEALQRKVERLEEVERAFVHLDYEFDHHPQSEHKTWGAN
ncbi:hypothetical protein H696_01799 [Fonticula alba]|uniref:Uncharacterized protein n=1 Tax=Fonticula alba TaxID=691883 RepID=A0A058ZEQ4_FONAL|nr:hypothetical protein H696_01799 [Fonticula alba]KCV72403.1 hypothetical protein H696_01799 [Fonticula alba]|eukprot:XP_009493981.1 hypothetical protein H696_01799 [Fonticula alba]